MTCDRLVQSQLDPLRRQADRLYVVTRSDLRPAGLRTAQVGHACIEWTVAYGRPPETLVVLQVETEKHLHALLDVLGGRTVAFREPDLDGQLTAVATGVENRRHVSQLRLLT